jgi:2'-5' RNA ligase
LAKFHKSFNVNLNGFDGFDGHTVYITISNKECITKIVTDIRDRFGKLFRFDTKLQPSFSTTPHLTIAKRITFEQYQQAINDWRDIKFVQSFNTDCMLLLKRPLSGGRYEDVKTFIFTGDSFWSTQLEMKF